MVAATADLSGGLVLTRLTVGETATSSRCSPPRRRRAAGHRRARGHGGAQHDETQILEVFR